MSIRQKAVQGYKWNLGAAILAVLIQATQVFFTAKFLSPEDFGVWGIIVLLTGFVLIFNDVGIGGAIIHHQDLSDKHLTSLYWLTVFVGIAVAAIIMLFVPAIKYFFKLQDITSYFLIIAGSVIVISLGKQFEILLQKELKFKLSSIIESVSSLIGFTSIIILLSLGYKVGALVIGFFITSFSKTLMLVFYGLKEHRPTFYFKFSDVKRYLSFGLFQLGEKNVNFFSERFDQIVIGRMLGAGQLGIYSFAFNLIYQPISKVNPIVNKISLPVFAKIQNNDSEIKNVYFKKLKILTYANSALLLGFFAVSQTMILFIFGTKWQQSIILIQLLSLVFLFKSIWNPIGSLLLALGKASIGFYWNILLVVVTLPIILYSSTWGNINYVGFCLIIAQVILFLPNYYLLIRPVLGNCLKHLFNSLTKPILISVTMCLVVFVFGRWLNTISSISLLTLLAQITIGITIQALLMIFFDRKSITEVLEIIKVDKKTSLPKGAQQIM